ncbi:MAG: hypothetical protein NVSMB6_18870 [Burkholderiaceae bacterium]
MEAFKHVTVPELRKLGTSAAKGEWIVSKGESGYNARIGEIVLFSVNGKKPRVFKSLESASRHLRDELGVREFKVEVEVEEKRI